MNKRRTDFKGVVKPHIFCENGKWRCLWGKYCFPWLKIPACEFVDMKNGNKNINREYSFSKSYISC